MKVKKKQTNHRKKTKKASFAFTRWVLVLGILALVAGIGIFVYKQYAAKGKIVLAAKTVISNKNSIYPWPCKHPENDTLDSLPCDASEISGAKMLPIEDNNKYPSSACSKFNTVSTIYVPSTKTTSKSALYWNHPWVYEWYVSCDATYNKGQITGCSGPANLPAENNYFFAGSGIYRAYLACLPVLRHPTCVAPTDKNRTVTRYCTYNSTLPQKAKFTSDTCSYPIPKCVEQQCPAAQKCPTHTTRLGAVADGHCGVTICKVTNPPKATPTLPATSSILRKRSHIPQY